jgi:hypothetical protein
MKVGHAELRAGRVGDIVHGVVPSVLRNILRKGLVFVDGARLE